MKIRHSVGLALALCCVAATAQTTIYESKDKDGPVFSDQPSPGAKELTLPPPNLVPGTAPLPQQAPQPALPVYRLLNILSPEDKGTVHTNTGAFEVRVQTAPDLRPDDRIRVKLDGRAIGRSFRSTTISLTEADWQAAASNTSVEHTLQAAVLDKDGKLLIESAPVVFYAHRTTANRRR